MFLHAEPKLSIYFIALHCSFLGGYFIALHFILLQFLLSGGSIGKKWSRKNGFSGWLRDPTLFGPRKEDDDGNAGGKWKLVCYGTAWCDCWERQVNITALTINMTEYTEVNSGIV